MNKEWEWEDEKKIKLEQRLYVRTYLPVASYDVWENRYLEEEEGRITTTTTGDGWTSY